jgi:hypothetical protein
MKKTTLLILIGLLLALALGQAQAGKPGGKPTGGNGGSGKGGFGDLGDGCLTFQGDLAARGRIYSDGLGKYCNGTDGQISVPVLLRFDTKKFNRQKRFFTIHGDCSDVNSTQDLCVSGANGLLLQMSDEANPDGTSKLTTLNWTRMATGAVTRVEMGIKIDNDHFLYFDDGQSGLCNHQDSQTGPVWVRCNGDANDDDLCDQWTVSTGDLNPGGSLETHACFKAGAYGEFLDPNVIADFTWGVCVMGLGINGCP